MAQRQVAFVVVERARTALVAEWTAEQQTEKLDLSTAAVAVVGLEIEVDDVLIGR